MSKGLLVAFSEFKYITKIFILFVHSNLMQEFKMQLTVCGGQVAITFPSLFSNSAAVSVFGSFPKVSQSVSQSVGMSACLSVMLNYFHIPLDKILYNSTNQFVYECMFKPSF